MIIPVEKYFDSAMTFSKEEVNIAQRCSEWLPDEIIDVHAHCNAAAHVLDLPEAIFRHMMSTFPWYTIEQSQRAKSLLFPGKSVRTIRFAHAPKGIDHKSANDYLVEQCPPGDRVALYGIPDDQDYTRAQLESGQYVALKAYYLYFVPAAKSIYEYFPPETLEVTQALGLPIILHLPTMITTSLEQLEQLVQDFPRQKVVLAHLGLPHLPVPGLEEAYARAAAHESVVMDTAMIPSAEVVAMALNAFGSQRIMFGSDEPVNLIRAVVFDHPTKGQRLAAHGYHWVDPEDEAAYGHLADSAVHMHWQALMAVRDGVTKAYAAQDRQESALREIFAENARHHFGM